MCLLANELEAVLAKKHLLDLPGEHLSKGRRKHCRRMCATACPSVNLRKKSFRSETLGFSLKPRSRDVCNLKVREMTN
jgi:hypothetical protein